MNLPYSREAEEALIVAILIRPSIINGIDLPEEAFYYTKARDVYAYCKANPKQIDVISVGEGIKDSDYVMEIASRDVSPSYAQNYAEIIKDKWIRRNMVLAANKLATDALNDDSDIETVASQATKDLTSLMSGGEKRARHIKEICSDTYDYVSERCKNPSDVWGIPTGFIDWDKHSGGLQYGYITLVSGEPGLGKTRLITQAGINAAKSGYPTVMFQLEMMERSIAMRLLSGYSGVYVSTMQRGKLSESDWLNFTTSVETLSKYPFYISASSSHTTSSIRAEIARLKAQADIKLVIIDHAKLIKDRISDANAKDIFISQQLGDIAKTYNVAMLVINTMSKYGVQNTDAGQTGISGSVEQNYDSQDTIFLRRMKEKQNIIRCTFEKNRDGEGSGNNFFNLVQKPGNPFFFPYTKGDE